MEKIYKPQLLIGTITLPQIAICMIFYKIFNIIKSELSSECIRTWMVLSIFLVSACILFTIYSIILWRKNRDMHPISGLIILAVYSVFLCIYVVKYSLIIPFNVPSWMILDIRPGGTMLTLLMPVLIHSMLILVHWTTKKYGSQNLMKETLFVIGVPAVWYILINLDQHIGDNMRILFLISAIAFVFFFVRAIYLMIMKKSGTWHRYLAPLIFIGSFGGLMLNRSLGNLFGDFSHWSFYVLNAITCSLMMIPAFEDRKQRLTLFIFKSITFIFTLYFFVVFLPFLPLSLIGMILFGLGVLILVPLALMLVHTRSLWEDFSHLKSFYKTRHLICIFLVGIIILPSIFILTIHGDRLELNDALRFTYQRSYEDKDTVDIDLTSVRRALTNIKYIKGIRRSRGLMDFSNRDMPYITSFYNQYVLDGLSISNKKIKKMELIFFGKSDIALPNEEDASKNVFIKDIKTNTEYDSQTGIYRSWIDMELQNNSPIQSEYSTIFKLPEGSYISNYYLYVGNLKKYGLIADKRAANWIYRQVKTVRRDPGLLSYIGDNKISFRIFPFEGSQRRKTGIEIIHKGPISLSIDGKEIKLGADGEGNYVENKQVKLNSSVAYVTKEMKDTLPKINRKPKYYFLIDYSKGNEKNIWNYTDRIKEYIQKNNIEDSAVEITALNYKEKRSTLDNDWEKEFQNVKVEGGLFLEYTIKRIIYESYIDNDDKYPVIILATDDFYKAVISEDIMDYKFAMPEGLYCYQLDRRGKLVKHSLEFEAVRQPGQIVNEPVKTTVLKWKYDDGKAYYLSDDKEDSIVLANPEFNIPEDSVGASKWHDAVLLNGAYRSSLLHPDKYFASSLSIVKNSIINEIMSPLTSFIVLENEAQEMAMLEKQKKILATKKPLDIGDTREMDEPSLLWMLVVLAVFIVLFRRRISILKG